MAFPKSFVSTTMVRLSDSAAGVTPLIDYLDQALQDQDADITNRGDGVLEFKVPLGTRLLRDLAVRWVPGRWPLSFVSAGSFAATPLRDHVVVTADVQISRYLLTRVGLLALISGALNPFGSIPSLLFGATIGLATGAVCYILARWEFDSWLSTLDRRVRLGDGPPGRLTSA